MDEIDRAIIYKIILRARLHKFLNENGEEVVEEVVQAVSPVVIEEFLTVFEAFWKMISMQCKHLMEINNRKSLCWIDLKNAGLLEDFFNLISEGIDQGDFEDSNSLSYNGIEHDSTYGPIDVGDLSLEEGRPSTSKKKMSLASTLVPISRTKYTHYTNTDSPILDHFPPLPPEHSYISTKIPLHPITDDASLRLKTMEFGQTMDDNLKRIVSAQLLIQRKARKRIEKEPSITTKAEGRDTLPVPETHTSHQPSMPNHLVLDKDDPFGAAASTTSLEAALDYFGFGCTNTLSS